MRITVTVRSSEGFDRLVEQIRKFRGELAFQVSFCWNQPGLDYFSGSRQVIYVPVSSFFFPRRYFEVSTDPFETAGAKSGTNVKIFSFDSVLRQASDFYLFFRSYANPQQVNSFWVF